MMTVEQTLVLLLTSRVCTCCNTRKGRDAFNAHPETVLGLQANCKECAGAKTRNLTQEQKDRVNVRRRLRRAGVLRVVKTPEMKVEYWKRYYRANKERVTTLIRSRRKEIRKGQRKRFQTDPAYRLQCCLRSRIWAALKGNVKSAKTQELVGCSIPDLKRHLESKFRPGITWENYGPVWHVDHIKPCASFDLSDPAQQRECFRYTNLQPLFAEENFSKKAKVLC